MGAGVSQPGCSKSIYFEYAGRGLVAYFAATKVFNAAGGGVREDEPVPDAVDRFSSGDAQCEEEPSIWYRVLSEGGRFPFAITGHCEFIPPLYHK